MSAQAPPEQVLALEVIVRALADLDLVDGMRQPTTAGERDEALRFLTDQNGAWAKSRRAWLDIAGIDHSAFDRHLAGLLIQEDDRPRKARRHRGGRRRALTHEQEVQVARDPRTCVVVGRDYGVSPDLVSKIRRRHRIADAEAA